MVFRGFSKVGTKVPTFRVFLNFVETQPTLDARRGQPYLGEASAMLDRGVSVRCVLMVSLFVLAAIAGGFSYLLQGETGWAAIIAACGGFVLVILNDNAKTRRALRAAIRELSDSRDRATLSRVP